MIDLHSHTTASDGQHPPTQLLELAKAAGVTTLAVTDHDTVAGIAEAAQAAKALGLALIPGIELSAFVGRKEVHILGHFVDPAQPELATFSAMLRGERETRMAAMVEKMRGLGFPVTLDEVKAIAQEAQLGRPHLALLLVDKGYCANTKEAFDRFLGDGRPACVDRYKLTAQDGIRLIRAAHGVATLAHPGTSRVDEHEIEQLRQLGLDGLEVFHSDHVPSQREKLVALAKRLELVPTAGSDFHGERVAPGRRLGTAAMAPEELERLRRRAA